MRQRYHILTLFFFTFLSTFSSAQRFSTGINFSTIGFQRTTLPNNFIYSQNSYYVYYTENEDKDNKPIFNQYFNGVNLGINVNVDYKRFMIKYEFAVGISNTKLRVLYPTPFATSTFSDNWSTFKVNRTALQHNLILTTKLNKKNNGVFLLTGLQYTFDTYKEQDKFDLDNDISKGIYLFISDNEMYGTLYNNNKSYFKSIIGLGVKRNNNYYSLRYLKRILSHQEDLPLASYHQVEISFTRTLSFQNLKKGYAIYIEE